MAREKEEVGRGFSSLLHGLRGVLNAFDSLKFL